MGDANGNFQEDIGENWTESSAVTSWKAYTAGAARLIIPATDALTNNNSSELSTWSILCR